MISERRPQNMEEFSAVVSKSCLIPDDRFSAALQRFESADTGRQLIHEFAKYLVEEKLLSEWQCDKLLSGRFKGFFHDNLIIQRQLRKDYRYSYFEAIDSTNGNRVVLRASPQDDGQISLTVVAE